MAGTEIEVGDPELEPGQVLMGIDRDTAFARYFADDFAVINRGGIVELAVIVTGPDPDAMIVAVNDDGRVLSSIRTGLKASYSEVARVRMLAPAAVGLAMHIIQEGIRRGQINVDALKAGVDTIVEELASSGSAGEAPVDGVEGRNDQ